MSMRIKARENVANRTYILLMFWIIGPLPFVARSSTRVRFYDLHDLPWILKRAEARRLQFQQSFTPQRNVS